MDDLRTPRGIAGRALRWALEMALLAALTAWIEWFYFGFQNVDFSIPIALGGDGLSTMLGVRNVFEHSDALLGWPYPQDLSAFSAHYDTLKQIFLRLCAPFTPDAGVLFNAYLFAIPLANVMIAYPALRACGIRRYLAYPAALTFGFCPYVQWRYTGHMSLAAVECIPLAFLLCLWCLEDERFLRFGRGFFRYGRNLAAVLFAWMIAGNGMVYYPFFTCFLFCVCALCLLLRDGSLRAVRAPATLIALVAFFLALEFLPTVAGMLLGHGNTALNGASRLPGQGMGYSLRLYALLLSPRGFGVPAIEKAFAGVTRFAAENDYFCNENAYSYVGLTASVGLLALLVCALSARLAGRRPGTPGARLWFLSRALIALLLLGVLSGLGALVNELIPSIRCYNRISPFIAFAGVMAVALCAQALLSRFSGVRRAAVAGLALLLMGYGLAEQQGLYNNHRSGFAQAQRNVYGRDEEFVAGIEALAGEGGMVFQLPYMRTFENGWANDVPDYDHYRGLAHSKTLRWSYGGGNGSVNDAWCRTTAALDARTMAEMVRDAGFAGIWLNLDGYEDEEGAALRDGLMKAAGCEEPLACADGHTIYISLNAMPVCERDPITDEIARIRYTATPKGVEWVLSSLTGDEASMASLAALLEVGGETGEERAIELPEGVRVRRKTAEERGELTGGKVMAEGRGLTLRAQPDCQILKLPVSIESDAVYKVELTLAPDADMDVASGLNVDLYSEDAPGGENYDSDAQQAAGFVFEGRRSYALYLDAGETGEPPFPGYVRLFAFDTDVPLTMESVRVTRLYKAEDSLSTNE